jgi:O-antigen/teichoic acid export membrane protein
VKPSAKTWTFLSIGASAFWLPDVFVHLLRRESFDSPDVWLLTVLMPLCVFAALYIFAKRLGTSFSNGALRMLCGIWLFGGVFICIAGTFSGGGFVGPDGIRGGLIVIAMSLIPLVTLMLATYDGSLGALTIATVVLLILWVQGFRKRRRANASEISPISQEQAER